MIRISTEDRKELIHLYDLDVDTLTTEADLIEEMSDYTYKIIEELEIDEPQLRAIEDVNGNCVCYEVDDKNNIVEIWVE